MGNRTVHRLARLDGGCRCSVSLDFCSGNRNRFLLTFGCCGLFVCRGQLAGRVRVPRGIDSSLVGWPCRCMERVASRDGPLPIRREADGLLVSRNFSAPLSDFGTRSAVVERPLNPPHEPTSPLRLARSDDSDFMVPIFGLPAPPRYAVSCCS